MRSAAAALQASSTNAAGTRRSRNISPVYAGSGDRNAPGPADLRLCQREPDHHRRRGAGAGRTAAPQSCVAVVHVVAVDAHAVRVRISRRELPQLQLAARIDIKFLHLTVTGVE